MPFATPHVIVMKLETWPRVMEAAFMHACTYWEHTGSRRPTSVAAREGGHA